jgi:AraC-like DNA-binding protein
MNRGPGSTSGTGSSPGAGPAEAADAQPATDERATQGLATDGLATAERAVDELVVDELVVGEPAIDEHCRRAPAEPLRPYVAWYTGYRQRGVPPARHRGLPSPFLTLIFTLDEPLVMLAHPDPKQPPGEFGALLGGLHSAPALIAHQGAQSGIQVALRPLGARALLGLPAGELAEIDVPAETVLGGACAELRARTLTAASWRDRFAILDEILLRLAAGWLAGGQLIDAAPEVGWAWRQLLKSGGAMRVSELAAETGWSARHLASRFRAEIGLTPKAAARVVRFTRARNLLVQQAAAVSAAAASVAVSAAADSAAAGDGYRLADLAVTCGYFDQAHLAREFRSLAGCPPSQWLAEEFRNVQAGAWVTAEAWVDRADHGPLTARQHRAERRPQPCRK